MKSNLGRYSQTRRSTLTRVTVTELKKQFKELKNKNDSDVWKWYWQVRLTPNLHKHKKNKIWQYYDWMFHNDLFVNYKSVTNNYYIAKK